MHLNKAVILFFLSSAVSAENWNDPNDIETIYFYQGHTGVLIKHPSIIDPDSCGRKDYLILPDNHPHFKEVYSLILAAQAANKKVSFVQSGFHQGFPAIRHIVMSKQ